MKLTDEIFQTADPNEKSYGIGYWVKNPKRRKSKLLKAILAGIIAGLKCLYWPDYAKRIF